MFEIFLIFFIQKIILFIKKMESKIHKNIIDKIVKEQKETPNLNNKVKATHDLEMQDLLFFLSDKDSFKQKFLIPHYKMYNVLLEINEKIKELRT